MSRLCLVDFDDTLIMTDSLKYIMIHEGWIFTPRLFCAGIRIIFCRLSGGDKLKARSGFKRIVLERFAQMDASGKERYAGYFRSLINTDLISAVNDGEYDRVIIISASEEQLIRDVIRDAIGKYDVIANRLEDGSEFRTCYGEEKIRRLAKAVPDYADHEITVYTDSYSDQPLIDIAKSAYIVHGKEMDAVK